MLIAITLSRGSVLGERTNDVSNGLCNLLRRMSLCIGRTDRRTVDVSLDVGSRTTNFVRSSAELITMRSPVGTVSYVLHEALQRGGELGVLRKHGADHAEECGDVTSKSGSGVGGRRVKLCKRRVWSIVSGRGVGWWNLLDIDGCIGGKRYGVARNFIDVNRRFLWGVVGEDRVGRRGGLGLASLASISQRRRTGPGMCGGDVLGHAGAETRVATDPRELELVSRSGTNLATVKGIESRDPLPIVINGFLVERDRPKGVVGWSVAEPVRDRRSVRERLIVEASNDTEVYDRKSSKRGVGIGSVVIVELFLRAKSNFVAVIVDIVHSDVLDGDGVKRLELRRYFEPGWKLVESDTTGYTVFAELELCRRGHGHGEITNRIPTRG